MINRIGIFKDNKDGTIKAVYEKNKDIIEISILFNRYDRDVICIPTHHYCNLGCKICHLTKEGFTKTMKKINVDDLLFCIKDILPTYKRNKKKLLVSFMGVGEPLLNTELIISLFKREDELKKIGFSFIGYSLSTMMPNDSLKDFMRKVNENNMPLKVHFSLHTPISKKRRELIPSTKLDVEDALELLNEYQKYIEKNRTIMNRYHEFHVYNDLIELHYTLIKDKNDSLLELKKVISYLKKYGFIIKLLVFNEKDNLEKSKNEDLWYEAIKNNLPNINIKRYSPPGLNIGSSCGKFTKHFYLEEVETVDEKIEFNKWKETYEIV